MNGCRWSIVYELCGVWMLLAAANGFIMILGTWNVHTRVIGNLCNCCLSCLGLGAVICACVFRFNAMGRLAALSLKGSKLSTDIASDNYFFDEKRTYQSDGDLILRILIS